MAKCQTQLCEIYRAIREQHQLNEIMVTIPILEDPNNGLDRLYVGGELVTAGIREPIDNNTYLRTRNAWIQSDIFASSEHYKKTDYLDRSDGMADAYQPIVLNSMGQIDPSMIDASTFYYVGTFKPTPAMEYPYTAGETHGAFWVVQGLGSGVVYTFATGDLSGLDVEDGDFMIWGSGGWSIMRGEMNPLLYYKLDGSNPITNHFQAGSFQIKDIADGTDLTDAVSLSQLNRKVNLAGDVMTGNLKVGTGEVSAMVSAQNNGDASNGFSSFILRDQFGNSRGKFYSKNNGYVGIIKQASDQTVIAEFSLQDDGNIRSERNIAPSHDDDLSTKRYVDTKEDYLGIPDTDGYILSSLDDGTRSWIPLNVSGAVWGSITGTIDSQTDLIDKLNEKENYLGVPRQDGEILASLTDGTRTWIPAPTYVISWGEIEGTLANQTDLQSALDLKLNLLGGSLTGELIFAPGKGPVIDFISGNKSPIFTLKDHHHTGMFLLGDLLNTFAISTDGTEDYALEVNMANLIHNGNIVWHEGNAPGANIPINTGAGDLFLSNDGIYRDTLRAEWGNITGTIDLQSDLMTLLDEKYDKGDFITTSSGTGDAGKPIILNSLGQIDPSMLDTSTFYYVSSFTPIVGTEYPDTTGETHGAFWVVQGLGDGVIYTFTTGDLSGLDIEDGDFMVWGAAGWSIMRGEMNPLLYYKLDGSNPITDHFAGGGFRIRNISDAVDIDDAITLRQHNKKFNITGGTLTGNILVGANQSDGTVGITNNGNNATGTSSVILRDNNGNPRGTFYSQNGGYVGIQKQASDQSVAAEFSLRDDGNIRSEIDIIHSHDLDLVTKKYADTKEGNLGNPLGEGYILNSTTGGERNWVPMPPMSTDWGAIGGILSNQTDLQEALDLKLNLIGGSLTGELSTNSNIITDTHFQTMNGDGLWIYYDNDAAGAGLKLATADDGDGRYLFLNYTNELGDFYGFGFRIWDGSDEIYIKNSEFKFGNNAVWHAGNFNPASKEDDLGNPTTDNSTLISLTDGTRKWRAPENPIIQWGAIQGTLSAQTDLQGELDGKEDDLGNPTVDGYILNSTVSGERNWVAAPTSIINWGEIEGTLANQTDLQSVLDSKLNLAGGTLTGVLASNSNIQTSAHFESGEGGFWIYYDKATDLSGLKLASAEDGGRYFFLNYSDGTGAFTDFGLRIWDNSDEFYIKDTLIQFGGNEMWHAGNFTPSSKENALGSPDVDGKILSSLADGTRSWITPTSGSSQWINDSFGIHYPSRIGVSTDSLETALIHAGSVSNPISEIIRGRTAGDALIIIEGGNMIDTQPGTFHSKLYLSENHLTGQTSIGGIGATGIPGQHNYSSHLDLFLRDHAGVFTNILMMNLVNTPVVGIGVNPDINGAILQIAGNASSSANPSLPEHLTRKDYVDTLLKSANIDNYSVQFSGNLTNNPSQSDLNTLIPSPIQGEIYGVSDTSGHGFLVVYDGVDFWYEKFKKAV